MMESQFWNEKVTLSTMTSSSYSPWHHRLLVRRVIVLLLLAVVFAAAFIPLAGQLAGGKWHKLIHIGVFAAIGMLGQWALPRTPMHFNLGFAVLLAIAHETCEIVGHHHYLEINDVIIDSVGGMLGVCMMSLLQSGYRRFSHSGS
ncbi:VanZ family protein [Proteobacteria bacterium 228]